MAEPNTFTGFCNHLGVWKFDHPDQVDRFVARKFTGCELTVTIEDKAIAKTRLQESGFHAMLKPWVAEGHQIDVLKRTMLEAVFGLKEVPHPVTGEVFLVLREPHTSKLTKAQYSELIERTLEIAAGCGVILEAPNEYKARKLKERRAAEKAARKGRAA